MRQTLLFSIFAFSLFIFSACNSEPNVSSTDIDQIKLELLDKSTMPQGITYQNNVYISYPIKTSNGSKGNEFKIVAKNNKLQIAPKEEVVLSAFAPLEDYETNRNLDVDNFYIEIIGYIEEVKEGRRFQKSGGIEAFR